MKTTIIFRLNLAVLLILLGANSFAQKDFTVEAAYNFRSEKSGNFLPVSGDGNKKEGGNISQKVLKHFNKKFINASDVKWEQVDDDFLATFLNGTILKRSLFTGKGKLIYSIDYSTAKQLPREIKTFIDNKYRSFEITSVAKISKDNRKIWIVKLAGKINFVAVRVENGEMEEVENFQRAN